jgi:uncharacterized membrane protein YqjE
MSSKPISAESLDADESKVVSHAKGWLAATQSRVTSVAQLALAEAKLAAISIAMMAFLGALAAAFALIAWGLCVAAIIRVLIQLDISIWVAMLTMALAHVFAAILLWRAASKLGDNLEFTATRKQFVRPEPRS